MLLLLLAQLGAARLLHLHAVRRRVVHEDAAVRTTVPGRARGATVAGGHGRGGDGDVPIFYDPE